MNLFEAKNILKKNGYLIESVETKFHLYDYDYNETNRKYNGYAVVTYEYVFADNQAMHFNIKVNDIEISKEGIGAYEYMGRHMYEPDREYVSDVNLNIKFDKFIDIFKHTEISKEVMMEENDLTEDELNEIVANAKKFVNNEITEQIIENYDIPSKDDYI